MHTEPERACGDSQHPTRDTNECGARTGCSSLAQILSCMESGKRFKWKCRAAGVRRKENKDGETRKEEECSWRDGEDGEQEGYSRRKVTEGMQNRGTKRQERKGWCGRGTDQKGRTGDTVMELIFLFGTAAHQNSFLPLPLGKDLLSWQEGRQLLRSQSKMPAASPLPCSLTPQCWGLRRFPALPSLSLPGPQLPGKSPQSAWHKGVPPAYLAVLKGKWDCRELLLCMLLWSS